MRYLLQFPSENQILDPVLKTVSDEKDGDFILYEKFEPFMLQVMVKNVFDPVPAEHLLAAFRILDP